MKIATVVGARPQFIKAVLVSRALRKQHKEILIHTGQHYDAEMSDIFFTELNLPKPDYFLDCGGQSPTAQVGAMIIELEKVLTKEKPDLVIVYGDTHSTLAGAVAAAKMNIPLAHIEAGLRSYHPTMQEEKNRIITDHLSRVLFCPTKTAVANLKKEGITKGVHLVGDVMVDSLHHFLPIAEKHSRILSQLGITSKSYFLATVHRAETADDGERLQSVFKAFAKLDAPIILPIHPRTLKEFNKNHLKAGPNVRIIGPIGYLDMLILEKNARIILTDSGGIQKEAYLLKVPCITLRGETEWPETLAGGCNALAGIHLASIRKAVGKASSKTSYRFKSRFGSPHAVSKIFPLISSPQKRSSRNG